MIKQLLTLAALTFSLSAGAQTHPLWMRYSAISPDGSTIAFSYKGDIYTVPVGGGNARQLTSNAAYDAYPVWSPDGQNIAFASTREGSMDIYLMNRNGGAPKRLTTDSGDEYPQTFRDNTHILFSANGMPTQKSIIFAGGSFPQVYEVGTNGGRPRLFSGLTMLNISINQRGDILYHDQKGYEDPYRKHHQSPITRDIWLLKNGRYTRLTTFKGEDRNPVWAPDGTHFYYLSETDGTFNVYKRSADGAETTQLTHFKGNPVRFLTVSNNGTLCFGYDGEIYTLRDGGQPQRVNVSVVADRSDTELQRRNWTYGASEIKVSPTGKEIAFVLHGDVYVTSVDYKTTKQITDTPEQERNIDFSPDGKSLVYASERGGLWQIYMAKPKNSNEKNFTYATDIIEEQLVKSAKTSQIPQFSPDGKSVAFFEDRGDLRVIDIKTKAVHTAMDGKYIYSYSDGDIWFEWSPDSKWLLSAYIGNGGWNNRDIALVNAAGTGEIHNLTQSGYSDGNGKWALGGKAMIFSSDRAGYRSHGSWGTEEDVYIMFFDLDAYDRFRMSKEERELADQIAKDNKPVAQTKKNKKGKKKDKAKKDDTSKLLRFDFANCRDRIVRLTVNSSHLGDAVLSPGGDTLYYQAAFEGDYDLWKHDLKENKTEIVLKGVGGGALQPDKGFKNLYLCAYRGIKKIEIGSKAIKNIDFEARFNYRPYAERRYMFDHIWQQVKDKFYDPKLHGVDWDGYRKTYERFLPYINNNFDFRDMLSEMLGELNASHTGARYFGYGTNLPTACLGVFYDQDYNGDGLKIAEVIKRSPLALQNTSVKAGCIIEKIDGQKIVRDSDYNYMLDGKVGKPVRLSVFNPQTNKRFNVTIRAISKYAQQELLYKRWVDHNRQLVDSLSGGRIAYVHVKAMNSQSFRTVYNELLSDKNRNREAVIVDERHNGGGWLHDDLCTLLSGKEYQKFIAHGKYIGRDPFNKWVKPSCVLICEDDYSNGHGFPFVYKELGIGKLIGAPIAGTMTAVWWESLIDPTMVFGIPQVGCRDMHGRWGENTQLNPDIEVYNSPEDYLNGNDRQIEKAVRSFNLAPLSSSK